MENDDLKERIHALETAQATQAATAAGAQATQVAAHAGVMSTMVTGAVSLITGIILGYLFGLRK
jgi:F0F1-type ATP synthase assembly protein I